MSTETKARRWWSAAQTRRFLEVSPAVLSELVAAGKLAYRVLPGSKGKQFDGRSVEALAESCIVTGPATS